MPPKETKKAKKILSIADVMTPFPHSINLEDSIATASRFMKEKRIRHLPVTSQGKLVSVLSDREISSVLSTKKDADPEQISVGRVCALEVFSVEVSTPLTEVLDCMAHRHLGSVVVLKDGRLAGIFTVVDACRCFSEFLRSA